MLREKYGRYISNHIPRIFYTQIFQVLSTKEKKIQLQKVE